MSLRLDNQVTAIQAQTATIDSVSVTLATSLATLQRIEAGTMVVSRPELIQIRKEIQDMEALLVTLQSNRTSTLVIGRLQTEIINVTTLLNELELNENTDTSDLLEQITNLRAKVDECKNAEIPSSLYDVWEEDGTQGDGFSSLHRYGLRSLYGAWFRDPVKFTRRVYSYEMPNGRYSNLVKYYGSLKDYHDGNDAVEIRLADSSQGTGLVAFNGSIYYNAYNSRNVAKFDVVSNQKLVFKALDDASYNNALPYRSAAYSDIDLLADQLGLWAVYSSTAANGFILISKLDQDTSKLSRLGVQITRRVRG
ncbi:amassin [Apostichopus japonicus]|uniref:Amassin n=1 Tax=Stichopus japonicus TaxID=307972 RepID=A0A2G8K3T6_STIJA|nr:amassin [Apostichopus japonicus]